MAGEPSVWYDATAVAGQGPLDWPATQPPGQEAEQAPGGCVVQASRFDKAISALIDTFHACAGEDRASLQAIMREQCCRMVDEQVDVFRNKSAQRDRLAAARLVEKNQSVQRMLAIKEQQQRDEVARISVKAEAARAGQLRAVGVAVTLAEARGTGSAHLLLALWAAAARAQRQQAACDRLAEQARASEASCERLREQLQATEESSKCPKSARRRQVGQENDPPRNGAEDASQAAAWGRTPPHLPGGRPLLAPADKVPPAVSPPPPGTATPHQEPTHAERAQAAGGIPVPLVMLGDMQIRSGHVRSFSASQVPRSEEPVVVLRRSATPPPAPRNPTPCVPPRTLRRTDSSRSCSPPCSFRLGSGSGQFRDPDAQVVMAVRAVAAANATAMVPAVAASPSVPHLVMMPSVAPYAWGHCRTRSGGMSPPQSPPLPARPPSPASGGPPLLLGSGLPRGLAAASHGPGASAPVGQGHPMAARPSPRSSPLSRSFAVGPSSSTPALHRPCPPAPPHGLQSPQRLRSGGPPQPPSSAGSFTAPLGGSFVAAAGSFGAPAGGSFVAPAGGSFAAPASGFVPPFGCVPPLPGREVQYVPSGQRSGSYAPLGGPPMTKSGSPPSWSPPAPGTAAPYLIRRA